MLDDASTAIKCPDAESVLQVVRPPRPVAGAFDDAVAPAVNREIAIPVRIQATCATLRAHRQADACTALEVDRDRVTRSAAPVSDNGRRDGPAEIHDHVRVNGSTRPPMVGRIQPPNRPSGGTTTAVVCPRTILTDVDVGGVRSRRLPPLCDRWTGGHEQDEQSQADETDSHFVRLRSRAARLSLPGGGGVAGRRSDRRSVAQRYAPLVRCGFTRRDCTLDAWIVYGSVAVVELVCRNLSPEDVGDATAQRLCGRVVCACVDEPGADRGWPVVLRGADAAAACL